jgi:hypothetical protein
MPFDAVKEIDSSVHEGKTQDAISIVPDYNVIPNHDSLLDSLTSLSPAEVQLMIDMLCHFVLAKAESDLGLVIKDKLDLLCKPKLPTAGQNKRHILELSIPGKIKKSLQRLITLCFEDMKEQKPDLWFEFPEAKAVKKKLPGYMDYRNRIRQQDIAQDLRALDPQAQSTKVNQQIKNNFFEALEIDDLRLSDEELELLNKELLNQRSCKGIFAKYVLYGGAVIERERMKAFLHLAHAVRQQLDRSDFFKTRDVLDAKLSKHGATILLLLFMHFNDLEKGGSLLVEGVNLGAETPEKLNELGKSLSLYESVGRLSLGCSVLMESPVWFFYSQIYQLKVGFSD